MLNELEVMATNRITEVYVNISGSNNYTTTAGNRNSKNTTKVYRKSNGDKDKDNAPNVWVISPKNIKCYKDNVLVAWTIYFNKTTTTPRTRARG